MRFRATLLLAALGAASATQAVDLASRGEVNEALIKVEASVRSVLKLPSAAHGAISEPDKTATRAFIVERFVALFRVAEPKFAYTPRPAKLDWKRIRPLEDPAQDANLRLLARWTCVAPYGPLTTSGGGLSLEEFGDALGFFVARVADLTHTPTTKFSPFLQRQD